MRGRKYFHDMTIGQDIDDSLEVERMESEKKKRLQEEAEKRLLSDKPRYDMICSGRSYEF